VFHAAVEREDLIDGQLQDIADRLCDGSLVPVLNQLVRRVKLSKADREQLRKLIDDYASRTKPHERS
jgi:predicted transcriptional regulator